jgi:DNA adenine methylase
MAKKGTTRTATVAAFRLADQIAFAAAKARRAMEALGLDEVDVEKTIWSSPAGKKRLAKRLAAMLPSQHRTYVEPFVGSGAVLFAKHPTELEVINDADTTVADAYRSIKKLTVVQPCH